MMRANRSNVHVLRIPLPFRLREVNLYLLKDHAGYTLIDTGPNTSLAVAALERELADLGVSWERIHTILITHYHSDHCGLAAEVRRRSGATIYMDRQDWELLQIFFAHPEKIIGPEEFYLREGMPRELVAGLDRSVRPLMDLILPFIPDRYYGEQEPIVRSPFTLVAVRTPGHTVGHTCFYEVGRGLFFCGDHVLDRITPNIAAHPLNPLADPLHAYLDSLALLRDLGVSETLAAHGPPIGDLARVRVRAAVVQNQINYRYIYGMNGSTISDARGNLRQDGCCGKDHRFDSALPIQAAVAKINIA